MQEAFLNRGSLFLYGRPEIWSSLEVRDRYTGLFAKDSFDIFNSLSAWAYGVCCCALNAVLNIATIAFVVEPLLLVGYTVSLILAAALLRIQAPRNERLAAEAARERIRLSSMLLNVWDNTTLGNRGSFERWREDIGRGLVGAQTSSLRKVKFATTVTVGIALFTLLPTIGALGWGVALHRHDTPYLIGVVVTLPRLFQILNTSQSLLSFLSDWSAQQGRFAVLSEFFVPPLQPDLEKRLKLKLLHATFVEEPLTLNCLEMALAEPKRITIRGPNGAGKSSLLMLLKARLGDRAFYLPSHHRLRFETSEDPGSTGEAAYRALEELQRGDTSLILLLDEWDANLDDANRGRLCRIIDETAQTRVVVEVRHGALIPREIRS